MLYVPPAEVVAMPPPFENAIATPATPVVVPDFVTLPEIVGGGIHV